MSDVNRYTGDLEYKVGNNQLTAMQVFGQMKQLMFSQEKDHLKAIAELEAENERLTTELHKFRADPGCTYCNWTCQKCGEFVDPDMVDDEETHVGCGGVCI